MGSIVYLADLRALPYAHICSLQSNNCLCSRGQSSCCWAAQSFLPPPPTPLPKKQKYIMNLLRNQGQCCSLLPALQDVYVWIVKHSVQLNFITATESVDPPHPNYRVTGGNPNRDLDPMRGPFCRLLAGYRRKRRGGGYRRNTQKNTQAKGKQMFSEYFKAQITLNKVQEKGGAAICFCSCKYKPYLHTCCLFFPPSPR